MQRPTSNIFSISPIFPDEKKSIDLMDDKNVYDHERMYKMNKFMKNRDEDIKTIVKKTMKYKKQNHIKTSFSKDQAILNSIQMSETKDVSRELEKYI